MAQIVEVSGDSVEGAIARALRQLGLNRDQVEVDVVREGRRGFLGIGAEEAIVRVTAKPGVMPPATRGGDRGRRQGGQGGRGQRAPRPQGAPTRESEEERQRREGAARAAAESAMARPDDDEDEDDEPPRREPAAAGATSTRGGYPASGERARGGARGQRDGGRDGGREGGRDGGRARGGRPRGRGGYEASRGGRAAGAITLPVRIPGAPEPGPVAPIADPEDEIDLAGRTLRDILTLLGLNETEITAREPETPGDGVGLMSQVFDITGLDEETSDELGLLIGRRGETLQSLQYLLNVIVSSRYEGDQLFAVDIEQYRRRREQSLVELAHRLAREVRATGDVITLEPMPPAERRIIHLALQEEEGVATASVGEGADRQVEIMPA